MPDPGLDVASPIRVYLVDDHEVVRRGLRELLEAQPGIEVVGESGSAAQAIRRIPALRPDVAVIDMRLPDGSGVDICRSVRSIDPTIRAMAEPEGYVRVFVTRGSARVGRPAKEVR